jgi:hypothetical protein
VDQIFGTQFRKQIQQHPLWLRIVMWTFAILFLLWTAWWILSAAHWVWAGYRRLAPPRQVLAGRLVALSLGIASLATFMNRWRIAYYLDPPMRNLVTTPGTHWQIFKLGLRARWNWAGAAYLAISIYPFFGPEWLNAMPVSSWGLREPLSILCAIGWSCFGQLLFHTLSIAWVLLSAALGLGGAVPRFYIPASLKPFVTAISFGVFALLSSALTVAVVEAPGMLFSSSAFWRVGEMIVSALEEPKSVANYVFVHFPSVLWFDGMRFLVPGPADRFYAALLGNSAWIAASVVTIALSCRAGLSMTARATWNSDPNAPKPADALPEKKRRHDPDHVNGPLEGLLVGRVGRMGRAVLRLIAAVYDVGAVDKHILYSLALLPLCVLGGHVSMWVLPEVINAGLALIQTKLDFTGYHAIRNIAAAAWIVIILFYRMSIWGGLRFHVQQQKSPLPPSWGGGVNPLGGNISFLMVRDSSIPTTRGDNRYPLTEIYPVGFSDAVLLPTFYTLLWVLFLGALVMAEGALLGLDLNIVLWCVGIGVPALVQLSFFAALLTSVSNWMDYRRSRLASFIKGICVGMCFALLGGGMLILIMLLSKELIDRDRAWVAWLGSLNMILIFDLACYMTARWIYVRRRFDAERRQQRGWSGLAN